MAEVYAYFDGEHVFLVYVPPGVLLTPKDSLT